jgi:hypothetical protein
MTLAAETPKRNSSLLLRAIRWSLVVWTGLFAFLVVPFTSLYEWNVSKRPVVTAYVSDPRLQWVQTKGGGGYNDVYVALDYDRPTDNGLVHCHLDRYWMGREGSAEVQAWTLKIAARLDTCNDLPGYLSTRPQRCWIG